MNRRHIMSTLLVGSFAVGLNGCIAPVAKQNPAIVLAAFGTSVPEAQKALENIDTQVRAAYPAHEVYWAFTANFIVNKLRKSGQHTLFARKVKLQSLPEVYETLSRQGVTQAVVQSLHVSPGQEYNEVLKCPTRGIRTTYGLPLLANANNIAEFATVLSPRFSDQTDEITLLCGHGNDHHPEYNQALIELDTYLRKTHKNTYVATVEGQPGTDKVFDEIKGSGFTKIKFVPVMIVAGDHIMNDVMSDEPDSWKSRLNMQSVRADKGLGENPAVIDLFIARLNTAVINHH